MRVRLDITHLYEKIRKSNVTYLLQEQANPNHCIDGYMVSRTHPTGGVIGITEGDSLFIKGSWYVSSAPADGLTSMYMNSTSWA